MEWKWNFSRENGISWKVDQKFPKEISEWKMYVPFASFTSSRLLAWIAVDPIFQEKVLEMEREYPREISIQDLTRPIYYNSRPTAFSERVDGKQPMFGWWCF